MRKRKYEIKERLVTEQVLIGESLFCDICGKEIPKSHGYWTCNTCHSDWGNDSIESYENFDICSVECLRNKFEEYCNDSNYPDGNTKEIHVEHTTNY